MIEEGFLLRYYTKKDKYLFIDNPNRVASNTDCLEHDFPCRNNILEKCPEVFFFLNFCVVILIHFTVGFETLQFFGRNRFSSRILFLQRNTSYKQLMFLATFLPSSIGRNLNLFLLYNLKRRNYKKINENQDIFSQIGWRC